MKKSSVAIMRPILAGYMSRRNIESCAIAGGIPSAARIGTRETYQSTSRLSAGTPDFLIQVFTIHTTFSPNCNHHRLDMAIVPDRNVIVTKHQIALVTGPVLFRTRHISIHWCSCREYERVNPSYSSQLRGGICRVSPRIVEAGGTTSACRFVDDSQHGAVCFDHLK